jgi:hypothetical protein
LKILFIPEKENDYTCTEISFKLTEATFDLNTKIENDPISYIICYLKL